MDILFVGGELAPMVRRSDAADVIASLSKALRALGHRVTIALPRFPAIERAGVLVARRLSPLVLGGGPAGGPTSSMYSDSGTCARGSSFGSWFSGIQAPLLFSRFECRNCDEASLSRSGADWQSKPITMPPR
jgi:hypothetical protein